MPRPHLEIQRRHSATPLGLWRTTFRDPVTKKVCHKTVGRITGVPLADLLRIQANCYPSSVPENPAGTSSASPSSTADSDLEAKSCLFDRSALKILNSREHGASQVLHDLAKDIDLDKLLYSRNEPWVRCALAMIIGRIVYQGSKLSLAHCTDISTLWEVCGMPGPIDVNEHCYDVMDRLLERQQAIQKQLANKHLQDGCLVLYDITSSYLEGEYAESEITNFGYSRDGKRGHQQIVIGLITNADGCYVIKTTVAAADMSKERVVATYKGLSKVEQAFRNLKTVSLELRPIYHRKDERIEAHALLCMLAYYLQWHMVQRLEPLLSEQKQAIASKQQRREDRKWTHTHIIEVLKALRSEEMIYDGVKFTKHSEPTAEQARLLALLHQRSPKEALPKTEAKAPVATNMKS